MNDEDETQPLPALPLPSDTVQFPLSRAIVEKLIDAIVHKPGEFFTADERDELLVALSKALKGDV